MRITALMVARNEGDVIAQTLIAAAPLLDRVLVVDCGSDDNTADEIGRAALAQPNIHFLGRLPPSLPEEVRPEIWAALRPELRSDDWLAILDADEFVEESLRAKLERATASGADHVFSMHANFYYTRAEAELWRDGHESLADRARPIAERRRLYCMHTSMPRLWRHLPWLRWNTSSYLPRGLAAPARERVIFRHYQYRDLPQIETRIRIRRGIDPDSELGRNNPHWLLQDLDAALSSDDDFHLQRAEPGQPLIADKHLPAVPNPAAWKSLAKRVLAISHACRHRPRKSALFPSGLPAPTLPFRA